MAQKEQPALRTGFCHIELLKTETLGIGSYGSVCKANCDNLICAAKIIHPTLVLVPLQQMSNQQQQHRQPIARFELECNILKDIRHPNIVQYLGMYQDPETGLPVLLMELMDESLTHFLENPMNTIPLHTQVAIGQDVATALSFLHMNGIIHRDLSSNNILLVGKGSKAKLTDFGMAKLVDADAPHGSNTVCPGTNAYMPPEAVTNQAIFTEKGDIFSFGVNVIQILTRKFPKPGDRFKMVVSSDPQFHSGRVEIRVSEVDRRYNHINEINPHHPLLPIALDSLRNEESKRPSSSDLCQRLAVLRDTADTGSKFEAVERQDIQTTEEIEDKEISKEKGNGESEEQDDKENKPGNDSKVESVEKLDSESKSEEEKSIEVKIKENKNCDVDSQEKQHDDKDSQGIEESKTERRENCVSGDSEAARQQTFLVDDAAIKIKWMSGRVAPCTMVRDTNPVVNGDVAYYRPFSKRNVYSYNATTDSWYRHTKCPTKNATLAIVNGLLTTIGGHHSNQLFSLTGEGKDEQWTEVFPPMPTKRCLVTAICTRERVVVVGGVGENGPLRTVEVMNTRTLTWSTAAELPHPISQASATICGDNICICVDESVITCSIQNFDQSCCQVSSEMQQPSSSLQAVGWSMLSDLPVSGSTLVSIGNCLLAIGGIDLARNTTKNVWMYDQLQNKWQIVSHLNTRRRWCFAVVLKQRIMTVGGLTSRPSLTDSVEFGSIF